VSTPLLASESRSVSYSSVSAEFTRTITRPLGALCTMSHAALRATALLGRLTPSSRSTISTSAKDNAFSNLSGLSPGQNRYVVPGVNIAVTTLPAVRATTRSPRPLRPSADRKRITDRVCGRLDPDRFRLAELPKAFHAEHPTVAA